MGVKDVLGVRQRPKVLGVPVGPKRTDWSQLLHPGQIGKLAGAAAAGLAGVKALSWLVSDPPETDGEQD